MHGMHVIPLTGGSNRNLERYQLNEMVRLFAEKLQGTPSFIHAPALTTSPEDYELYMGSSSMKAVMEMWRKIDIAVVSVGAPPVSQEFDGSRVLVRRKKIGGPGGAAHRRHLRALLRRAGQVSSRTSCTTGSSASPWKASAGSKRSSASSAAWKRHTRSSGS